MKQQIIHVKVSVSDTLDSYGPINIGKYLSVSVNGCFCVDMIYHIYIWESQSYFIKQKLNFLV